MKPPQTLKGLVDAGKSGQRLFANLNLSGNVLQGEVLNNVSFKSLILSAAELFDVAFIDCEIDKTIFARAVFHTVLFRNCIFNRTSFEEAKLESTRFIGCRFVLCSFTSASLIYASFEGCAFEDLSPEEMQADYLVKAWVRLTAGRSAVLAGHPVSFDRAQLTSSTFVDCTLTGTRFRDSVVSRTKFVNCKVNDAETTSSRMTDVGFEQCDFAAVGFDFATLETLMFRECILREISFVRTALERTTFTGCFIEHARIARALFLATNVDPFCLSVDSTHEADAPIIDWRSLARSIRSPSLHLLLVATGVPNIVAQYMIDAARAVDPDMLFKMMRSTFISYGAPDRDFARALRDLLEKNGVRTFFFERDAVPGERIHQTMYQGVNKYDRVILICSEASLQRSGVRNEIEETFARESRDGGASYLVPVARDDFVLQWTDPLAMRIRDRVVADFRNVDVSSPRFIIAFDQLLRALRVGDPTTEVGA